MHLRVPSMMQFRHGSWGLVRSHLHLLFRHWSHALLLRRRICFSAADLPPTLEAPYDPRPMPPSPEPGRSARSSAPSSS